MVEEGRTGLGSVLRLALTAVMLVVLAVVIVSAEPPETDRARSIGGRISCPVCVGETIRDSAAGLAQDMMGLVDELIAEGQSDEQIIDRLLSAYPGSTRLDPGFSSRSLALWLLPVLGLGGGIWLIWASRRSRSEYKPSTPPPE